MSIYLIRHTAPLIEKGTCYGQADIDVMSTFQEEAAIIRNVLPTTGIQIYSSPLQRCRKLAEHLFPSHSIQFEADLKEISCGEWELLKWDDIPKEVIDPWMNDFVNVGIPGGESYVQLFQRVVNCFTRISQQGHPAAIVTHGGVIRSIIAHLTNTPLIDSFKGFSFHYGCVVKLDRQGEQFSYEMLSNIATVKEQHKPQY